MTTSKAIRTTRPQSTASAPGAVAKPEDPAPTLPPIVAIGASAGGLEAFEAIFRSCPEKTGMAFVLIPHLDPDHQSLLTEILQRSTAMPVIEAIDCKRSINYGLSL